MANEITVSVTLGCINGKHRFDRKITGVKIDQAAQGSNGGVQEITNVAMEAIALGDLGTLGYVILRNLDDTNFVQIGRSIAAAFEEFTTLNPGEAQLFRFAAITPYALADTAPVNLEYMILED